MHAEVGGQGLLDSLDLYTHLYQISFLGDKNDKTDRWKFMGNITAARLRESGASDVDEPRMRRRCARRESHGGLTDSATPVVGLGI